MTSPSGAGTYGMTDGQLLAIIQATQDAVDRMNSVRILVEGQADQYIRANNSESGQLMRNRLITWTGEFNQIVGNLDQLNHKVTLLRQHNAAVTQHAASQANGAHG